MKNSDVFTFFEPFSKSTKTSYVSNIKLISAVWINEATYCSSEFPGNHCIVLKYNDYLI